MPAQPPRVAAVLLPVPAVLIGVGAVQVAGAFVSSARYASAGRVRPWCRSRDLLVLVADPTAQLSGTMLQVGAHVAELSDSV